MHFTDYFIRNPVSAITLCLFILLAGGVALCHLTIRLMPKIDIPIIEINTLYPGASAKIVQDNVTTVLQNTLAGITGIDYITSSNRDGQSDIQIHFKIGLNATTAMNNVINKIESARQNIPPDVNEPVITKLSADDKPIMIIAYTSPIISRLKIGDYLQRMVKPKLELLDGVASADIMGERYAMRIWLDPKRLVENELTPFDIAESIKNQNISAATGIKKYSNVQFELNTNTGLSTAQEFNQIIIKNLENNLLRLKDVGVATLGAESSNITTIVNGIPATMIFIKLLPEANSLLVSKLIHNSLPEIKKLLPNGVDEKIVFDASRYIHSAINELNMTIVITSLIILLVIFIFLGSRHATIIPVVTIPLSLIGVNFFLWVSGCSLNILTMLAMVLAIGLVVDDAIIVLENIHRNRELGLDQFAAASLGTKEIVSPIISMSIILAVVYFPIAFIGGILGKFFSEFALTLSMSIIISGVIALTLSPMLCARLLSQQNIKSILHKQVEWIIFWLRKKYTLILIKVIKQNCLLFTIWIILCVGSIVLYTILPKELAPREDQGFLQVMGSGPDSSNANYLARYTQELNQIYQNFSDIDRYVYINNIPEEHQFLSYVTLHPNEQRNWSTNKIHQELQDKINEIAGIQATVIEPSGLPIDKGFPVEFVLKGAIDYRRLYQISEMLKQQALQSGKFIFLDQDIHFDKPQITIQVNRSLAAYLGIRVNDITNNLSLLLSENTLQQINMQGQSYPVILHVMNEKTEIEQINLKNSYGEFIPLTTFVNFSQTIQPNSFNQFQKINSITLQGVMQRGHSLNEGLSFLRNQIKTLIGVTPDYSGESRIFMQENINSLLLFLSSLLVVYLILAIFFNSFSQPLVILFACLPGALFAALLALFLFHITINIYTEIGMLTLIGLVSKHGILITQFANRKRKNNTRQSAVQLAATLRFRPILMTTTAMVLSALPLIFASGPGSHSRFDLGIVIAFGVLFGTIAALIYVPFFYCLLPIKKNY